MCHPSPENSHDSFSESTDWASVPVRHSPPQAVIFRVADRVAAMLSTNHAGTTLLKGDQRWPRSDGGSETLCCNVSSHRSDRE